jgi:hypothetical protein
MSETMSQEFARVGITQSKVFFGWYCMQSRLDVKQVRILFNRQKTAFRKKQRLGFNIARQKVHISQQPFRPHQKKIDCTNTCSPFCLQKEDAIPLANQFETTKHTKIWVWKILGPIETHVSGVYCCSHQRKRVEHHSHIPPNLSQSSFRLTRSHDNQIPLMLES